MTETSGQMVNGTPLPLVLDDHQRRLHEAFDALEAAGPFLATTGRLDLAAQARLVTGSACSGSPCP